MVTSHGKTSFGRGISLHETPYTDNAISLLSPTLLSSYTLVFPGSLPGVNKVLSIRDDGVIFYSEVFDPSSFSTVATTGEYSDLNNIPNTLTGYGIIDALSVSAIGDSVHPYSEVLSLIQNLTPEEGKAIGWVNSLPSNLSLFSGNYEDLSNLPVLFSGSYTDLSNKPTLFSGNYNDLSNKPDLSVFDNLDTYANLVSFPATGASDVFYVASDTGKVYRWDGSTYQLTSGELPTWGNIQGTLSDQSDLNNELSGLDTRISDLENAPSSTVATEVKTANFTAASNTRYAVDTTLGVITATLPASPTEGDTISFFDVVGFDITTTTGFGNNALVVIPNAAHTIQGATALEISEENACVELVFQSGRWNLSGGLLSAPLVDLTNLETDISNLQTQTSDIDLDLTALTEDFTNHNHDSLYAALSHTHNYAATSHTHSYAAVSHTHSYASTSHTHSIAYWSNSRLFVRNATNTGGTAVLDTDGRIRYLHWNGSLFYLQIDATWMIINHSASDIAWKENIEVLDSPQFWEATINAAYNLPIVSFDWNDQSPIEGHESIGIIAQELEQINPDLIRIDPDGHKHVDVNKCVVMLLACVKHLKTKTDQIDNLAARITDLENS
jgi:hypothetical protein